MPCFITWYSDRYSYFLHVSASIFGDIRDINKNTCRKNYIQTNCINLFGKSQQKQLDAFFRFLPGRFCPYLESWKISAGAQRLETNFFRSVGMGFASRKFHSPASEWKIIKKRTALRFVYVRRPLHSHTALCPSQHRRACLERILRIHGGEAKENVSR